MLRISLQTLRARRATLAGAFVAIWLAVTLASATGLLMAGALGPPGAGRLAAADAVVRADPTVTIGRGEDAEGVDVVPGPRLPASAVARVAAVPGVARAVGDIAFPAGAWDAEGRHLDADRRGPARRPRLGQRGAHPVPPDRGPAPGGPRDVVADVRLGARVGATLRDRRARPETRATASAASPTPAAPATRARPPCSSRRRRRRAVRRPGRGRRDRRASPSPGRRRPRCATGCASASATASRSSIARHAADADAGDPTAADRAGLIAIFGAMGGIAGAVALFVVAGTFAPRDRAAPAGDRGAARARRDAARRSAGSSPARRCSSRWSPARSGSLAGRPLAEAIVDVLADRGEVGPAFAPARLAGPARRRRSAWAS